MKTAHAALASLLLSLLSLTVPRLAHAGEGGPSGSPGSVLDSPSSGHRLDVGCSFGFNNTGGMGFVPGFGLDSDVRRVDFFSLGAG
ncbi:hypothetical protein D7X74_41960, partial [Corallococcus sp. CA047B]|uniref:hypothetical protein n=1 Tax=Corallococcus sp. CA047B TaxID=2316729 RepID=UPI000ED69246